MSVGRPLRWLPALSVLALGTILAGAQAGAPKAGVLFGPNGPSPQAVRQGYLGSCYFHASIAALSLAAPDRVRQSIESTGSGDYVVHFASGPDEMVYAEDVQFGREHHFDHSEGDWVLVLMRAYAQRQVRQGLVDAIEHSDAVPAFMRPIAEGWLNDSGLLVVVWDRSIRLVISQDGTVDRDSLKQNLDQAARKTGLPAAEIDTLVTLLDQKGFFEAMATMVAQNGEVFGAYKSIGQGGIPGRVIEAFLGPTQSVQTTNRQSLEAQLERLHQGGVAMVANTRPTPPGPPVTGSDWFVPEHAYTVLDYDQPTQSVRLRNPWGAKPYPDGVFTVPLEAFAQGYETFTYSQ
jgi:hypothetical protein